MNNSRYTKLTVLSKLGHFLSFFMVLAAISLLAGCSDELTGILNPKGIVAYEERILLFDSMALMMIVVIPVIIMSIAFVYKYRESQRRADYKPNWSHSFFLEALWWGIPIVIVVILGVLSWKATHRLDPYQKIDGRKVDLRIDVIALPWKWLFIYPNENIATINELVLPKDKQVELWLTGDNSAMAAFFVPQLASQIYTMAGMRTKLHIIATEEGTYRGLNAQFNGGGFSDMYFPVHVVDENKMSAFIKRAKSSQQQLSIATYLLLREPSIKNKGEYYASVAPGLFQTVINYYMQNIEIGSEPASAIVPHHHLR